MYKTVWKSLKEVLRESKFISIFFLFLAQLSNLSNLVYGYISKLYVDKVSDYLSNKVTFQIATKSLIYITIGAICFYVLNTMFDALYDYIWGYWKADTYKRLRLKYIQRLKDLPLPVYEAESVGRVQEKIGAGTNSKVEIANTIITNLFPELVLVSVALPILFRKNSSLALVGLMGLPLFVIVRYLMFKKVKPHLLGARKAGEDYGAIENELFHQIKIIKAFNKSDFQYNYLKDKAELQLKEQVTVNTIYRVYNIFSRLTVQIPRAIVVGLAAYIALQGKLTAGDVMLFATYVGSVTQPLWNLSRALNAMQEQSTKSERLDELLKNESEFANDSDKNVKNLNESISFNSVSYSYENKRDVLKGLNLTIEKDKVTALVGPSGVGKSTVVKLLLRFTEPTKGEVLIGNINLNLIPKKQIRGMVGLVFQDSLLFNNTVTNNIKFGKTSAPKEDVIRAAKNANAHDFIMKLPKKYNTIVGERGVKLSGGEQQRINLARAILKNPPILVLDEATSSLDAENERIIQEALWKLIKNRTTIIIAHRLSTVKKADKIVFLKDGKVAEEGTHQELMEKKGLYYKHFRMQGAGMLEDDKLAKVG